MPSARFPAFAKINLRLHVLGTRPDGYHELRTVFQAISLHDTLELETQRAPRVDLTIQGDQILAAEGTSNNLVYRALAAGRKELQLRHGVRANSNQAHSGGPRSRRGIKRCGGGAHWPCAFGQEENRSATDD